MAVLDSTFLIDVFRNEHSAIELLRELERKEGNILVASPTVMELWFGAVKSRLPAKGMLQVEELIASANVLVLDAKAAKHAAEIQFELEKKGSPIQLEDVMIAGIAISNGEAVITRDAGYAQISGLKVLKY
ncbi:PIN domain-containing protein [Candidatus Woesearchaeota archaeon]|nr:PIN domain-containing protein [Candidatus Woesearchaeota archaeon]